MCIRDRIGVIVATVIHYARKGFVAGIVDLVGNLAAIALAWFVSGKVSPTVFENFFKSGLVDKTTQTLQQGSFNLESILGGLEGLIPQSLMDGIMESAESVLNSQAPNMAQQVVEQIIRPTGLVDPPVEVRPAEGQIDDLLGQIRTTIEKGYRVLATTLTKKMAERLTERCV